MIECVSDSAEVRAALLACSSVSFGLQFRCGRSERSRARRFRFDCTRARACFQARCSAAADGDTVGICFALCLSSQLASSIGIECGSVVRIVPILGTRLCTFPTWDAEWLLEILLHVMLHVSWVTGVRAGPESVPFRRRHGSLGGSASYAN